jgi:hypothetical protein
MGIQNSGICWGSMVHPREVNVAEIDALAMDTLAAQ